MQTLGSRDPTGSASDSEASDTEAHPLSTSQHHQKVFKSPAIYRSLLVSSQTKCPEWGFYLCPNIAIPCTGMLVILQPLMPSNVVLGATLVAFAQWCMPARAVSLSLPSPPLSQEAQKLSCLLYVIDPFFHFTFLSPLLAIYPFSYASHPCFPTQAAAQSKVNCAALHQQALTWRSVLPHTLSQQLALLDHLTLTST